MKQELRDEIFRVAREGMPTARRVVREEHEARLADDPEAKPRWEPTARALDQACHTVKAASPDDAGVELYTDDLHEEFKQHLEDNPGARGEDQ